MRESPSSLPLEAIINTALLLDQALREEQFPQARHHALVLALRADEGAFSDIAADAKALMTALAGAIRPGAALWSPIWARLRCSIDEAFEASLPKND